MMQGAILQQKSDLAWQKTGENVNEGPYKYMKPTVMPHKGLQALENEIAILELRARNRESGPSAAERQQLRDLIKLLTDVFQQQLYDENDNDQKTYNNLTTLHEACTNHKDR